jgi:hypothetical protein
MYDCIKCGYRTEIMVMSHYNMHAHVAYINNHETIDQFKVFLESIATKDVLL